MKSANLANQKILSKKIVNLKKPSNLKEALRSRLTKKEFEFAPRAFDTFGNIAVIEIPKELSKKKKLIGEALLETQPRFETVCSIESEHEGKFRVQSVKVIAGKKNMIADYKESACSFLVPLGKVFFSPRLGAERLRVANQIKKGETIGCWFSGVGPYPIVFAKHSQMEKAIAIELNPDAHKYAIENAKKNKVTNVDFIKGDVKKQYKKFPKFFDRISMPLPHTGYQFLSEAFFSIKKGGIIYFYEIVTKDDFKTPETQIKDSALKAGRKIKIISKKKVRVFSPTKEQVVFDIKVLN
jgi:tRNA (guanine37-N1)-methyltransferase